MDQTRRDHQESLAALDTPVESQLIELSERGALGDRTNVAEIDKIPVVRKYLTKHMKMYPELYRSDVSIHPSYSGLKTLPYYVICRRRALKKKKQITRQLNREILHIVMMQSCALTGAKIDRIFSIGFPPEATHVPDFATHKERRRINELMAER